VRPYLVAGVAFSTVLVAVGYLHSRSEALVRWIPERFYDPNQDATTELWGWQSVDDAIQKSAQELGPEVVVASGQYALCAQIMRKLDDRPAVYCPSKRRTEFDFIGRRNPPQGATVVFVNDDHYPEAPSELMPRRNCELAQTIPIERGGRLVRHYRLYACSPEAPDRIPPGTITLDEW
jgi:hypothetical protein